MPLRRLTRFSRLELDKEKDELERAIELLDAILADERLLRKVVSDELADVAKAHGTPRRPVLLASAGTTVTAATASSLEVADDPCFAYLSSSGLLARTSSVEHPGHGEGRANHDVVVSAVRTTARGEVGVLTSRGRLVKVGVLDMPSCRTRPTTPTSRAACRSARSVESGERALALTSLPTAGPGLALGTRAGVVKRVNPEVLGRDEWEVIGLKDGDEVIGAVELRTGEEELCFISSDAQLLHFPAGGVRPQGRPAAAWPASSSARASTRRSSVPSTRPRRRRDGLGLLDGTPRHRGGIAEGRTFTEYPARAARTGGVRSHRFLKGEDVLVAAWAGVGPARAARRAVHRSTCRAQRPARRVRHPAPQPIAAVASLRRGAGRATRRCGRLRTCLSDVAQPWRPPPSSSCPPSPRAPATSSEDTAEASPKRSWRSPARS